ncbi:hypothetical protein N7517_009204 [Penicillium concentricum]|uniref:Peptidase A1 domain-containing protein n=1 Tax=Penicillium concentricum TaxID=293559 RepID=A0A9W9RLZ9_9EURO|nr:uncharacterized protein N7517_009204 [Penicillium concentricum]KAJ5360013.1 hypothetical protein N7517_009204 [Penicillium concentricum]
MRSGFACLLGLAGLTLTNALSLEKRDRPAVLTVPLVRDTSRQLSKRSKTVDVDFDNEKPYYYITYVANMTFGTPPQSLFAYIDTWGNGCWVRGVNNTGCEDLYSELPDCGGYGSYNLTASSTGKKLDGRFAYDDNVSGLMIGGDFVTDVLKIGGITVDAMKMGLAADGEFASNTLGLGYGNASSTSLPQALADAGTINSPAFSLWGQTALFGGVNKAKYNSPLHTFPIVNGSDLAKAFRINIDGISINKTSAASKEFPLDAVFDTSFGLTYVPKSVAQALNAQIGKTSVPDKWGQVNFSCSAMGENSTIEFKFGELEFQFYLSDFVTQESLTGANYGWDPETETCYFAILENINFQYEGSIVLGSNFMSKVYAVFDLENDEISLANLNRYDSPDDIVEIKSGKNAVPEAKKDSEDEKDSEAKKESAGTHIGKGLGMSTLVVGAAVLNLVF